MIALESSIVRKIDYYFLHRNISDKRLDKARELILEKSYEILTEKEVSMFADIDLEEILQRNEDLNEYKELIIKSLLRVNIVYTYYDIERILRLAILNDEVISEVLTFAMNHKELNNSEIYTFKKRCSFI